MSGNNNMFSDKDTMDINELASLNNDISPELIEQLQQQISQNLKEFNADDDTTLFEEVNELNTEQKIPPKAQPFEDKFLKKFQEKQQAIRQGVQKENASTELEENTIPDVIFSDADITEEKENSNNQEAIEQISNGNITEKAITQEQKNYNDSLDFLDGNVKYSKYVIYIDPQNVNFIENLTVKERKNLINKILREQDDIGITKHRFRMIQMVIRHAIVAILTFTISIPIIYYAINASLEASINNYRRSQTNFQILYKEKGKINKN